MTKMRRMHVGAVLLSLVWAAGAADLVPFVIPATPAAGSLVARHGAPITVTGPRVSVRGEHFAVGATRFRVWGVNSCFGASFPTHADAERIAARLEATGVNSVRFHHMDSARYPSGILDPKDMLKLAPEAVDRLDYFIDQLARRGIYANVNLHVGRAASQALGLPAPNTGYDKIVGIFTPALIAAQQQYARDLLGHVNPYRQARYADDAAVAFVEISNEDSFFMWSGPEDLRALPPHYAKLLHEKYAAWLRTRYASTEGVQKAWAAGAEPLGTNTLSADLPAAGAAGVRGWRLEQHPGSAAEVKRLPDGAWRVAISRTDDTNWHLQFKQSPLTLKQGAFYTISFRARADRARGLSVGVGMEHEPWQNLGFSQYVRLTPEWQTVRAGFVATATDDQARLSFSVGADSAAVELADVVLAPGGRTGLGPNESLEAANIALFGPGEVEARSTDRTRFLMDTEKAYFDGMKSFLRKELGTQALVTGTTVFGPCGLYAQSGMDFLDGHAYWQHPSFPGKAWDGGNWTVEQRAMVDHPESATLPHLAAERLAGKPFTVSEYNHPAPNDFQAECVPMSAAYAAAQDWDGIWYFAYSHRTGDVDLTAFRSFFDIDMNPAKWGFMQAGAALFRDAGLPALAAADTFRLDAGPNAAADIARKQAAHGRDLLDAMIDDGRSWASMLQARVAEGLGTTGLGAVPGAKSVMAWSVGADHAGMFTATGSGGYVGVGRPGAAEWAKLGVELSGPAFVTLVVAAVDGRPLADSRKILITACGRCENVGMGWSADRRTVGWKWGNGPVGIEPVTGAVRLPPGAWRCRALGPDGLPTADVPVQAATGSGPKVGRVSLSPQYRTMWYLATRE